MAQHNHWYVTYYALDDDAAGELYQEDGYPPPIKVGEGLVAEGGKRYRVVDIWHSDDKHGHFDIGTHVFLREVTDTADDRPGNIAPHYFRAGPAT